MSRILVTTGLLFATFGQSNAGNQTAQQTQQKQQAQQKQQDWHKYVNEYAGGSQGGDYQKYMKKYAGGGDSDSADKQDVATPAIDLLEAAPSSEKTQAKSSEASGSQSQEGGQQKQQKQQDWHKYVNEYAGGSQGGDYQKYMKKYAGGGQGGSQSQDSADHKQDVATSAIDLLEAAPSSEKTQAKSSEASGSQSQEGGQQKQQKQQKQQDWHKYVNEYAGGSQGGDYQKYMKKYAGGGDSDSADKQDVATPAIDLLQAPATKSSEASGSQSQSGDYQKYMKKYAGGSQGGDYQQYMKKYAGGSQGGSSGSYQQYMKKYAGGSQGGDYQQYMKKYAGGSSQGGDYQQYSDYQKYMKRDQEQQEDQVVRSAQDAKNKSQLDAWKASNKKDVQWYVPAEYQKKAVSHVEQQYNQRLAELNNETQSDADSTDDLVKSIINLVEIPKDADAKEKKAVEVEHLRRASEQSIKKAQDYGESLKRAAADNKAIENTAAAPVDNVVTAFDSRAKELDANIADLQTQVKSKQTNADFAKRMHQTAVEVQTIRADELRALEKAHHESNDATRHAARGVQNEIRHEARKVRALSDHMARLDSSTQDNATELQNRAENTAEVAEAAGESLARRTQDHLETQISKARESVRKNAEHRSDAMREVQGQFKELEAAKTQAAEAQESITASSKTARSSSVFLAQYADNASSSSAPLLGLGAAACTILAFVIKHNRRTVEIPSSMLG